MKNDGEYSWTWRWNSRSDSWPNQVVFPRMVSREGNIITYRYSKITAHFITSYFSVSLDSHWLHFVHWMENIDNWWHELQITDPMWHNVAWKTKHWNNFINPREVLSNTRKIGIHLDAILHWKSTKDERKDFFVEEATTFLSQSKTFLCDFYFY